MGARTRIEIVTTAMNKAGVSVAIRTEVNGWFNDMLRTWAFEHKWPKLKKIGAAITVTGVTAPFPTDFGAGMDNLLFGDDKTPLAFYDLDDFVFKRGFEVANSTNARPDFYTIDENNEVFRFNRTPDKSYSAIPIYYSIPTVITADATKPWFHDDEAMIQGLIAEIYQYTEDSREDKQNAKVEILIGKTKRGILSRTGGSKTLTLARGTFPTRRVGRSRVSRFRWGG